MRSMKVLLVLGLMLAVGCGGATPTDEPLTVTKTKHGNLDAVTVQNGLVRVTFVPSIGGRITEYTLKSSGHNEFWANPEVKPPAEVGAGYYGYGGLDDHLDLEGVSKYPATLTHAPYACDVKEGPDNVTVTLTYEGKGWKLQRTHRLFRGSTRLFTRETVTNTGSGPRMLAPRPHPVFAVGEAADNVDCVALPVEGATLLTPTDARFNEDIFLPVLGRWAAVVDRAAKEAVVMTFDPAQVADFNLWCTKDSYNLEPMQPPVELAPGQSRTMTFDLYIVSDKTPVISPSAPAKAKAKKTTEASPAPAEAGKTKEQKVETPAAAAPKTKADEKKSPEAASPPAEADKAKTKEKPSAETPAPAATAKKPAEATTPADVLAQASAAVKHAWELESVAEGTFLTTWGTIKVDWPAAVAADNETRSVTVTSQSVGATAHVDVKAELTAKGVDNAIACPPVSVQAESSGTSAWEHTFSLPLDNLTDDTWTLKLDVTVDNVPLMGWKGPVTTTLTHPVIVARELSAKLDKLRVDEKDRFKPRTAAAMFYLDRAEQKGVRLAKTPMAGEMAIRDITDDVARAREAVEGKLKLSGTGAFPRFYLSSIDDSPQGYLLFVPADYNRDKSWPLLVDLHGRDSTFSPFNPEGELRYRDLAEKHDCILVMPHGRGNLGYRGPGEDDVMKVMEHVRSDYNVDPSRVYITGTSMGGGGTWYIAEHHPDLFAAAAPVFGPTDPLLSVDNAGALPAWKRFALEARGALACAENLVAMPIWVYHGAKDKTVPVENSRRMVARLKALGGDVTYEEDPEGTHLEPPGLGAKIFDFLLAHRRPDTVERVTWKLPYLQSEGARQVNMDGFGEPLKFGEIRVERPASPEGGPGNNVQVTTSNVSGFTLSLKGAKNGQPLTFQIDGGATFVLALPAGGERSFQQVESEHTELPQWGEGKLAPADVRSRLKSARVQGPMRDAFNSRFILVVGTMGDDNDDAACMAEARWFNEQRWRRVQHVDCLIRKDTEIVAADVRSSNLVLIGGPRLNRIVQQIDDLLPVTFRADGSVDVDGTNVKDPAGAVAFIYPNPTYPVRYIMVLAGNTTDAMRGLFSRVNLDLDYQVFHPDVQGTFNQKWQFDKRWQWGQPKREAGSAKPE